VPPSLERFRILAKSQGVSRYFVGALLAAWLACLTAVHFPLPRLYDFPDPRLGPRENLGFLAFSACAGLHGLACRSRLRWMWDTAARSRTRLALAAYVILGALGHVGAAACASQSWGVDMTSTALVWQTLYSISVIFGRAAEWAAVISPLAFVVISSSSPLVPWSYNVLYNGDSGHALRVVAVATTILSLVDRV